MVVEKKGKKGEERERTGQFEAKVNVLERTNKRLWQWITLAGFLVGPAVIA